MKTVFIILLLIGKPSEVNLTRNEAVQVVYQQARRAYLPLGIDIRTKRIIRIAADPSANLGQKLSDQHNRFRFLKNYTLKRFPELTKKNITYAMVPPVVTSEGRWPYGTADAACYKNIHYPFAFGSATRPQSANGNGYKYSAKIMAHELGHLFNASHPSSFACTSKASVMCSGFFVWPLRFSLESIQEIKGCLR